MPYIEAEAMQAVSQARSQIYGGLAVAVLLHAGVIALLLAIAPVRSALTQAVPIMVRLVASPQSDTPKASLAAKPIPVKPRAQPHREQRPAPVAAAPGETPAPLPAAPLQAAPTVESRSEMASPAPIAPAPAAASAPAPPVLLVAPSFDAAYLANPPPAYPALSRRLGEEGKAVLRVFVNEHGLPTQVDLRASSGHARLDDAAVNTVKQWKFVPARRGDTPVGAWVLVPIAFSLRN